MSIAKEIVVAYYKKGYRVDENGFVFNHKGERIYGSISFQGYRYFSVRYNGKTRNLYFHRLCAYQKYGDKLFEAQCVRHLNGDSLDNRPSNIAIGTHSDNKYDMPKKKRVEIATKGSHSYIMKWNDDDVKDIKKFYDLSHSYKKTMEKFGILSKSTLYNILKKR